MLAGDHSACVGSLESQTPAAGPWPVETRTVTCFAGLTHSTVPLLVGGECIGFLHTGQIALEPPTEARFAGVVKQLAAWGAGVNLTRLKAAYFQSRVLTPGQYHSTLKLLEMFVQHLSLVASQVALQETGVESSPVCRAKRFIAEHQGEPVTLAQVARTQHMSTFYFCKTFKKATGLTFTDYLGRLRIETAKGLLLNPNRRVSEVAYTVGFSSLTHFNRLFSKHACQSPTAYRAALPVLAGARG
jgi:AraC-like DNA-binding protein